MFTYLKTYVTESLLSVWDRLKMSVLGFVPALHPSKLLSGLWSGTKWTAKAPFKATWAVLKSPAAWAAAVAFFVLGYCVATWERSAHQIAFTSSAETLGLSMPAATPSATLQSRIDLLEGENRQYRAMLQQMLDEIDILKAGRDEPQEVAEDAASDLEQKAEQPSKPRKRVVRRAKKKAAPVSSGPPLNSWLQGR